jgi:breast cancer metastasis-suppressor 1-like protein
LWDSLKADLEEKIHMLEEDKHNVDFLWDIGPKSSRGSSASQRRKADPLDPDRRKKPVTVTGPYVVYMLDEAAIIDDWTAIKKSLTTHRKKIEKV